jgi:hypothetical protein
VAQRFARLSLTPDSRTPPDVVWRETHRLDLARRWNLLETNASLELVGNYASLTLVVGLAATFAIVFGYTFLFFIFVLYT